VEKNNTSKIVFDMIEQKLLSQEWKPGMKIDSETKIANDLGVGRSSVRESIDRMIVLGILSRKQGGGTYVNHLSTATYLNDLIPIILLDHPNILDVIELREVLETACIRMFVERCTDAMIDQLEETYVEMLEHRQDEDGRKFAEADNRFHVIIGKGTENAMFTKLTDILTKLLIFYQKETFRNIGVKKSPEEHRAIIDAIKAKDSEMAVLLMKRHIQNSRKHIIEAINRSQ
jgi:DNA-binding FadR family transcriptional regulator